MGLLEIILLALAWYALGLSGSALTFLGPWWNSDVYYGDILFGMFMALLGPGNLLIAIVLTASSVILARLPSDPIIRKRGRK